MNASSQSGTVPFLEAWLTKHGFSLEFAVADVLTSQGWQVAMGVELPGQDGKPRDVDVLAKYCFRGQGEEVLTKCVGYLLVECKHIPDARAWALMGARTVRVPRTLPSYIPSSFSEARLLSPRLFDPESHNDSGRTVVMSHGATEARFSGEGVSGDSGRDTAHASVRKVVDLSWSLAGQAKAWDREAELSLGTVVVPCIVVRGKFGRIASQGESVPLRPVDVVEGAVLSVSPPQTTRVDIVRIDAFGSYLGRIKDSMSEWTERFIRGASKRRTPRRTVRRSRTRVTPRPAR